MSVDRWILYRQQHELGFYELKLCINSGDEWAYASVISLGSGSYRADFVGDDYFKRSLPLVGEESYDRSIDLKQKRSYVGVETDTQRRHLNFIERGIFPFGEWAGVAFEDCPPPLLLWYISGGDFDNLKVSCSLKAACLGAYLSIQDRANYYKPSRDKVSIPGTILRCDRFREMYSVHMVTEDRNYLTFLTKTQYECGDETCFNGYIIENMEWSGIPYNRGSSKKPAKNI